MKQRFIKGRPCLMYIGPLNYAQKDMSWCTPWMKPTKRYTIFAEAKKACSLNENCTMFFDSKGKGNYYLCGNDDKIRIKFSSKGSIRYVKEEGTFILCQLQFVDCVFRLAKFYLGASNVATIVSRKK